MKISMVMMVVLLGLVNVARADTQIFTGEQAVEVIQALTLQLNAQSYSVTCLDGGQAIGPASFANVLNDVELWTTAGTQVTSASSNQVQVNTGPNSVEENLNFVLNSDGKTIASFTALQFQITNVEVNTGTILNPVIVNQVQTTNLYNYSCTFIH